MDAETAEIEALLGDVPGFADSLTGALGSDCGSG